METKKEILVNEYNEEMDNIEERSDQDVEDGDDEPEEKQGKFNSIQCDILEEADDLNSKLTTLNEFIMSQTTKKEGDIHSNLKTDMKNINDDLKTLVYTRNRDNVRNIQMYID